MAENSRRKAKKVPQRKAKKVPQRKVEKIPWRKAIEIIKPFVVKIYTPRGSGTGFLCAYTKDKEICGIATAEHVLSRSHYWEEPIRIQHYASRKIKLLREPDRIVRLDSKSDTAVIIFAKGDLPLPKKILPFISAENHLRVGEEMGWVGFPAVSQENLCFFSGRNSYWMEDLRVYLVDGVAIQGVSGGPAFYTTKKTKEGVKIIGSVSAYLPNREGDTPGLAMISHVDHFLKVIKEIKDWSEAKKKETPPSELKEEKKE